LRQKYCVKHTGKEFLLTSLDIAKDFEATVWGHHLKSFRLIPYSGLFVNSNSGQFNNFVNEKYSSRLAQQTNFLPKLCDPDE
jgi:hypothetical protein